MMRIGIKYCGGCNPRYDRTKMVSGLRKEFPGLDIFSAREDGGADLVVVICGCGVRCADHARLTGRRGKIVLSRESDYEILRRRILEILQTQKEIL